MPRPDPELDSSRAADLLRIFRHPERLRIAVRLAEGIPLTPHQLAPRPLDPIRQHLPDGPAGAAAPAPPGGVH